SVSVSVLMANRCYSGGIRYQSIWNYNKFIMNKQLFFGWIFVLFMTTTVGSAAAQKSIPGQVVDAQNHKPLAGANISYGNHQGTTSDASGHFRIPCHSPMEITVSYTGYKTKGRRIKSCQKSLEISLVSLSYSLQHITVRGRNGQVKVHEASSTATLSTTDLHTQSGLRLREAMNTVPGVEMQSRSPWGGQRITIRGYYPNAGKNINFNGMGYQLYLNDVPVTDATGTTIMDAVDFATLGRVKIVKGPSPFYGNEIAGAVNLYSERPQENGTSLSEQVVGGSYGLLRNNTALKTKNDNMDLTLNYGRQSYNGFRPHDASKKDYFSGLGHFNVSDKEQITAYFSYEHSDEQLAGNIDSLAFYGHKAIANPDYVNNNGGVKLKGFRAGITSFHTFNKHFSNKTTVFGTGHTLDQNFAHGFNYYNSLNVGARTNFTYQQQLSSVGITGQLGAYIQHSDESQNGVFIPPFVHPPFKPSTKPQFPTDNQNYALNYNVFAQWQFALPMNFKVTVGGILNVDKFGIRNMLKNGSLYDGSSTQTKTFDPSFSPSTSVLKSFDGKFSLYASINTGDSPPLLSDIIAGDGSVNERLKPEHAVQYEVGSKAHLLNDRFYYKLALFDLKINNRLATQYINDTQYTTNVGKQQNKGLELALGYDVIQNNNGPVSHLRAQFSYTYAYFRYDNFKEFAQNSAGQDSVTANYSGNKVAGVPPNRFNLGVNMQTSPGFYLHANLRYMDKTTFTFDNKHSVKSYTLLSGRIGYKKQLGHHVGLNAFVGSNNLTGSTYYNFLFVGQNVGSLGDGYVSPAPYKPTIYGGVTLKYWL
ncbi:MAG TPA: TonB-dependent receptor, partial [Balneolaceae bacterium]|nr:TonB-dependent receptor [Balneolaceae bacterium]